MYGCGKREWGAFSPDDREFRVGVWKGLFSIRRRQARGYEKDDGRNQAASTMKRGSPEER
jgi:hypothetical protein